MKKRTRGKNISNINLECNIRNYAEKKKKMTAVRKQVMDHLEE